jgi:cysteine-rich repeat protein
MSRSRLLLLLAPLACSFDATGLGEADASSSSADASSTTAATAETSTTDLTTDPSTATTEPVDPTTDASEGDTTPPPPPACGDGVVDAGEDCDDGRANAPDAPCTPDCRDNVCGDGHPLADVEDCDDGNDLPGDGCEPDCTASPGCGDGEQDPGEGCDDGNADDDDGCVACQPATCGDGVVWANVESCDDGGESPVCNADCSLSMCGDQKVNASALEACDLGAMNGLYGSGCNVNCTGPGPSCGDGSLDPEEVCDTLLPVPSATCDEGCQTYACDAGRGDCDGAADDGCEVDLLADEDHCGECSESCTFPTTCKRGECKL